MFEPHLSDASLTHSHSFLIFLKGRLEITSRAFGLEGWLNDLPTLGRRRRIAQTSALFYVATVLAPAAAARQGQGVASVSAVAVVSPWDGNDLALMLSEYRHGSRRDDDHDHDDKLSALDAVINLAASILDRITAAATTTTTTTTTPGTATKKKEITLADILFRALMVCAKGPPRTVRQFLSACCRHQKLAFQVILIAQKGDFSDPKCDWVEAVLHIPTPSSGRTNARQVDAWDKIYLVEQLEGMISNDISAYYDEGTLAAIEDDEDCLRVMNDFFAAGIDATMFDMVYDLPPPIPPEEVGTYKVILLPRHHPS